jgi:hypothetical protein
MSDRILVNGVELVICPKCGKPNMYIGAPLDEDSNLDYKDFVCTCTKDDQNFYGWLCPRCGKALAPWMSECDCYIHLCTGTSTNYTTDTGGSHDTN